MNYIAVWANLVTTIVIFYGGICRRDDLEFPILYAKRKNNRSRNSENRSGF
jgi:hypothetical protein